MDKKMVDPFISFLDVVKEIYPVFVASNLNSLSLSEDGASILSPQAHGSTSMGLLDEDDFQ